MLTECSHGYFSKLLGSLLGKRRSLQRLQTRKAIPSLRGTLSTNLSIPSQRIPWEAMQPTTKQSVGGICEQCYLGAEYSSPKTVILFNDGRIYIYIYTYIYKSQKVKGYLLSY